MLFVENLLIFTVAFLGFYAAKTSPSPFQVFFDKSSARQIFDSAAKTVISAIIFLARKSDHWSKDKPFLFFFVCIRALYYFICHCYLSLPMLFFLKEVCTLVDLGFLFCIILSFFRLCHFKLAPKKHNRSVFAHSAHNKRVGLVRQPGSQTLSVRC